MKVPAAQACATARFIRPRRMHISLIPRPGLAEIPEKNCLSAAQIERVPCWPNWSKQVMSGSSPATSREITILMARSITLKM